MDWNLNELRDLVTSRYGLAKTKALNPSLNSTALKLSFARYHADEANARIEEFLSETTRDEPSKIIKLIFEQATESDIGKEFRHKQFVAEANIIAFAQSLHSVADILSQLIYECLDLKNNPSVTLRRDKIYLSSLAKSLDNVVGYSKLNDSINRLLESDEFMYLNALVNTSKHICVVHSSYSITFVEKIEPLHGMRILGFNYNNKPFDKKWTKILLDNDFKFLYGCYVDIGVKLNECIK